MNRFLLLACLAAPSAWAQGPGIAITTPDGVQAAKSIAIREIVGELSLEFETFAGERRTVRCADVVEIAIAPPAPAREPGAADVVVALWTGDVLHGTLGEADPDGVRVRSGPLGEVKAAFDHVESVRFLANRAAWRDQRPARLDSDLILTRTKDERQGTIQSIGRDGVAYYSPSFKRDFTLKPGECAQVFTMTPLPSSTPPAPPRTLYAIVQTADGSERRGTLLELSGGTLRLRDLFGQEFSVPAAQVSAIYFRNGRVLYLSDAAEIEARENANYIRHEKPQPSDKIIPFQRDANADQKSAHRGLSIRGQEFRKGLGTHSRSELTFALDGSYQKFEAVIGIDDCAARIRCGSVVFQVLADGRKVFDSGPVSWRDEPRPVSVPIRDVRRLTLLVDFGDGYEIGDYADWALARVIR